MRRRRARARAAAAESYSFDRQVWGLPNPRSAAAMPPRAATAPSARLAPVDGVRAVATLSLVALHTATLATAFLPLAGPAWTGVTQHPLFGVFLGGGAQTDVFLLLGGLLTGLRLRGGGGESGGLALGAARRALRLWPVMVLQMSLGFLALGEPLARPDWTAQIVASVFTFSNNYGHTGRHTTLACTPGWSVCVDFQCGLCLYALVAALRSAFPDALADAAARWLLLLAFLASLPLRFALFSTDPRGMSVIRMPLHFGQIQSGGSSAWFESHYAPFKWLLPRGANFGTPGVPSNAAAAGAFDFLSTLYFPTHARFGPYVLGAFLAFSLPTAAAPPKPSRPTSFLRSLPMLFFSMQALATLAASMMPPPADPDTLPDVMHAVATVAGPSLGALAAGFLLYTALCPAGSMWHNAAARRFLSWRGFRGLAQRSFAVNMLHFRIILSLLMFAGLRLGGPGGQMAPEQVTWPFIVGLYLSGLVVSLAAAEAAGAVEPALRGVLARVLYPLARPLTGAVGWRALAGAGKAKAL